METASHGSIEYPFQFYDENMEQFDFNCVDWHWHTELEFVLIESDYVTMWIGDQELTLSKGDAIFINTKMLHKFHSPCAASIPNFLKVAAAKLSDTEKMINTISTECGFNSIDYFCRAFKKQYDMSPSKYRKNKLG
jgi:hypothetical protein